MTIDTQKHYPVTMSCTSCKSLYRIYNVGEIVTVGIYKYCANCGSDKVGVIQDQNLTYWEYLGQQYGMNVEAIQTIYDLWIEDRSNTKFDKFVRQTTKMLRGLKSS